MSNVLGDCLWEHYEKYLGMPIDRQVFRSSSLGRTIQILAFDGVLTGCRVFASLGLSHFRKQVGGIAEVVVPIDGGWDEVPAISANALFRMIDLRLHIGRGTSLNNISAIAPEFSSRYGKDTLYFTTPYGFPEEFSAVACDVEKANIYLGIFLSKSEGAMRGALGAHEFEGRLEEQGVDPYHLLRKDLV